MRRPRRRISPESGTVSPASAWNNVVLPHPERPRRQMSSLSKSSNETSSMTAFPSHERQSPVTFSSRFRVKPSSPSRLILRFNSLCVLQSVLNSVLGALYSSPHPSSSWQIIVRECSIHRKLDLGQSFPIHPGIEGIPAIRIEISPVRSIGNVLF